MTNQVAVRRAFEILAKMIHDDYSAGPDGHRVYKTDVYKMMDKAGQKALEKPKPIKGVKFI